MPKQSDKAKMAYVRSFKKDGMPVVRKRKVGAKKTRVMAKKAINAQEADGLFDIAKSIYNGAKKGYQVLRTYKPIQRTTGFVKSFGVSNPYLDKAHALAVEYGVGMNKPMAMATATGRRR